MSTVDTHYPSFNVLDQMELWDSHTKEIVRKRIGPFPPIRFFTGQEARDLSEIARHIVYDNRMEIINWVVHYIDQKMLDDTGENQRGVNTPPEKVLIREGLRALNRASRAAYGQGFADLETDRQFEVLADLQLEKAPPVAEWKSIPQKDLFNKLAGHIISAYYSHPTVWSEIGYGGPVYPNVYVRVELGLTDPWEAKRDGK